MTMSRPLSSTIVVVAIVVLTIAVPVRMAWTALTTIPAPRAPTKSLVHHFGRAFHVATRQLIGSPEPRTTPGVDTPLSCSTQTSPDGRSSGVSQLWARKSTAAIVS